MFHFSPNNLHGSRVSCRLSSQNSPLSTSPFPLLDYQERFNRNLAKYLQEQAAKIIKKNPVKAGNISKRLMSSLEG